MKFLTILIPAYNESKRIKKTLKKIKTYLKKQKFSWEVLIVDDGSKDNSKQKIAETIKNWKNFQIIGYQPNRGKGAAVKYGIFHSAGKHILFMDADGATAPDQFEYFKPYLKKYPIIISSRYLEKGRVKIKQPPFRILIAKLSNLIIRSILLLNFKDTQNGFKCFESKAAKKIFSKMKLSRWGFDFEILALAKKYHFHIKEVAIDWYNDSDSRVKPTAIFSTLKDLFLVRWNLWTGKYNNRK